MKNMFFVNKMARKSEISFSIDHAKKATEGINQRIQDKYKKDIAHYESLLHGMVDLTMKKYEEGVSDEEGGKIFHQAEAEWKIVCARVRQTNKHLRLDIGAYKALLIDRLTEKENELR